MEKYRKVRNTLNGNEGYISLSEYVGDGLVFTGMGILEFIEKEWTYYKNEK